jgi:Ser/Thr protein kinase RdoA (MazF antagonist)
VPLPDTVVHEEIHDGNVVVRDGACVVIDWADSCVGHPFFGVVVGLRSIGDRLGLEPGAEPLERLVQAYLDPWSAVAPVADLRAVLPSAYRLGMLNRALSWGAGLADLTPAAGAEHLRYVEAWVEEFTGADDPLPGT